MTHTNHTDSVEAAEKEYQRQLAIATSVGEKYPHISAFIGAWDVYDGMMNDCYMTSKDRAQMRKMLTTLQATQSQQVEEAVRKRNGVIKEYKDEGVMFVLKVEDGKTYEASMPIPKWAEVGKLTFRDHEHDWIPCPGTICTSDLHTHHCSICRKHAYQPVTPNHQD